MSLRTAALLALSTLSAAVLLATPGRAQTSKLWGEQGELWTPTSRLPDFSHAGYHDGELPIPDLPVTATVTDFGAVGDGVTDDTAAFLAALAAAGEGAVLVPKGRYLITGELPIDRSKLVLRGVGSGQDGSVLYISKSLTDVHGAAPQWSWYGGFIHLRPAAPSITTRTTLAAAASRGDSTLKVTDGSAVAAGDVLLLRLLDDGSGSLGRELHGGHADAGDCSYQVPLRLDTVVRVASVSGDTVTLTQPLRLALDPAWKPELAAFSYIEDVGVEHLAIEFVEMPYAGHLFEPGYNAISFNDGVVDGWVRDVRIQHSDNGILTDSNVAHLSLLDVTLEGRDGHHGLNLSMSSDLLVQGFSIEAGWVHAMTLDHRAHGVVFSRMSSTTKELALDHHRDSPFENLFTEITAYNFASGGNTCAGPHAGARNTYWNLASPMVVPFIWGGTETNAMGDLSVAEQLTDHDQWYEVLKTPDPPNLYEAQLGARMCTETAADPCQRYAWDAVTGTCVLVPKDGPTCGGSGGGGAGSGGSGSGAGTSGAGGAGSTGAGAAAGGSSSSSESSGCGVARGGDGRAASGLALFGLAGLVGLARRRRPGAAKGSTCC
jgi:hypothetical protein